MLFAPIRWAASIMIAGIVMYMVFFVPIGQRTTWEHLRRIGGTPEAQEFGREVRNAGERVVSKAEHELRAGIAAGPTTPREPRARVAPGARP